ncbi:MAG TPA: guanitoxin biosynthesis MBL fold metallo-hydrolase GntH [Gemmataceae bacterium]|nr:guanitoxin biosynthesis MBL fold metallo-hydrolase GntH [Gemmataceae bacterium]
MKMKQIMVASLALTLIAAVALIAGSNKPRPVEATQPAKSKAQDRAVYVPNTEPLAADEMRVISCGTGMSFSRRSQACSSFLVELGNGDKFLFDIGAGAAVNIGSLEIPYDYLDKVFLSHLHTDHFGDFAALYIGGWIAGRQGKFRVWGPSGAKPEHGTKHALTKWREALAWDIDSRRLVPSSGGELEINEFDYQALNKVVYQENGVTIRSWPAIHCLDGPVSYSLEFKGLEFVFSGDTVPNKWYDEYARKADLAIHESYPTTDTLVEKMRFNPHQALFGATAVHTQPAAFGAIMSRIEPRMAVAYHFINDPDTGFDVYEQIRRSYKGPLTLANDLVCWNVNKDKITVREVLANNRSWPAAPPKPPTNKPDATAKLPLSPFIVSGRMDDLIDTAIKADLEAFKKKYGIKDEK